MLYPRKSRQDRWRRHALGAGVGLALAGTAGLIARGDGTPLQGSSHPREPVAVASFEPAVAVATPGRIVATDAPAAAATAAGNRDQRFLMLMLLGNAAGSAGPFGRLVR